MFHAIKTGTCCYCGAQTTLELRGEARHELSCAKCGAPLRRMKMLPMGSGQGTAPQATPPRPKPSKSPYANGSTKPMKSKKKKKNKSLGRKAWSEFWDVIEDIID